MEICDFDACTGCSACKAVCAHGAITMQPDDKGFERPRIDGSICTECGLCVRVCPNNAEDAALKTPCKKAYAYRNTDEECARSSSGAAFPALAEYVLANHGVVYGACFDEDFRVVHKRCATREAVQACRGSKYSQSAKGDTFERAIRDLKAGRVVLYTGTPCEIAGLKAYLGTKRYQGELITCDIICHGVPSNAMFRDFVSFIERKAGSKLISYEHRPKDRGWGVHVEKARFENGKSKYDTVVSNTWREVFYSNDGLRSSCYRCLYTSTNRPGDFTIADFHGIQGLHPEFFRKAGVSAVMANTDRALAIVQEGVFDRALLEVEVSDVVAGNPMLARPSEPRGDVQGFWQAYFSGGYAAVAKFVGAYGPLKYVKFIAKKCLRKN